MLENQISGTEDISKLSSDLSRYLDGRDGAADTFEGLVSWWLFRAQLSAAEAKVRQAVDHLERQGLINKRTLHDGKILYFTPAAHSDET